MNDYYETPNMPEDVVLAVKKTGRVCKYCKNTGLMRGIPGHVWNEINKVPEYKTMTKEEQRDLQERFIIDIPCNACTRYERSHKESE